jgi:hypothetical protein
MPTRKTHYPRLPSLVTGSNPDLPDQAALAALRAWYAGLPARDAVVRYLPDSVRQGQSARRVISDIRRQLIRCALARHRDDPAPLFALRTYMLRRTSQAEIPVRVHLVPTLGRRLAFFLEPAPALKAL